MLSFGQCLILTSKPVGGVVGFHLMPGQPNILAADKNTPGQLGLSQRPLFVMNFLDQSCFQRPSEFVLAQHLVESV